jgi:hypothetical protein
VLKFTTLGSDAAREGFAVAGRAAVGRAAANAIAVPSDGTMRDHAHCVIDRDAATGVFSARVGERRGGPVPPVAVRVGAEPGTRAWPLTAGAAFCAGNSLFVVDVATTGDVLALRCDEGPRAGETLRIGRGGATLGRSAENSVAVGDRELSRRHSAVDFYEGVFYLRDLDSTNGTYMRLVGPYAGPCALALGDRILVARTGSKRERNFQLQRLRFRPFSTRFG